MLKTIPCLKKTRTSGENIDIESYKEVVNSLKEEYQKSKEGITEQVFKK